MAAIDFDTVSFSYDGMHHALDELTLSIERGSFTCILGGNGSGKSTFAKHVNALLSPDSGSVRILDLDTSNPENVYPIRASAGMVFQNPDDQLVASVIEEDVAFGPENLGLPSPEIRKRVDAALEAVGLSGFERNETSALSGGQKQRVAIAGVLAMHPEIIVFDEAGAMLDPRGRNGLLRVCHELNDKGMTIVLITHYMEDAAEADHVIVMKDGHVAASGTPSEVLTAPTLLQSLYLEVPFAVRMSHKLRAAHVPVDVHLSDSSLATQLAELLEHADATVVAGESEQNSYVHEPAASIPKQQRPCACTDPSALIKFENVSFTYQPHNKSGKTRNGIQADWGNEPDDVWALKDVTFSIERGEFVGIAGHTGSGKSTLAQLACGLLTPTSGTVRVEGADASDKKLGALSRGRVGVVFQYPEHQLFAATVAEDVAFGPRNMGVSESQINERVRHALEMVHLDLDEIGTASPFALSGGQQRRVAFAGVLAMEPDVLILDEPVAGLDPATRASFLELIEELHEQRGLTVVVVSHNMDDLARLSDRVLVLDRGRVLAFDAPQAVFADEAELKAVGLGVPHVVHLANDLAERGFAGCKPQGGDAFSEDALVNLIATQVGAQR